MLLAMLLATGTGSCRPAHESGTRAPSRIRLAQCESTVRSIPRDSVPTFGVRHPPEILPVRISRSVPGGFTWLEGDTLGPLVLEMVDTTRADTIRSALAAAFTADGYLKLAARVPSAVLRHAAFSAADLVDWQAYLTKRLYAEAAHDSMALSGIGADFHNARVVIAVPSERQLGWVQGRLAKAAIPCGLVELEIEGSASADRVSVEKRIPQKTG